MDKQNLWRIGANCTDVNCKKAIPNSDCFAGLCKCKAGFGPSHDQRKCKNSKKHGDSCNPILDSCYQEKLYCDQNFVCQCAPGYRHDFDKNDCIWYYYCDGNMIYDSVRGGCIKPSDYWFPTTNHNPKLSFITFILLVFCFIKVMRSNTPYNERRRRISANTNRNSFDLLSTIMNYDNNQRYPARSADASRTTRSNHPFRRNEDDGQEVFSSFDENQPPPPYEEIVSDLKMVTVINDDPSNTAYLSGNQEDIELKEMNQGGGKLSLQANSQPNLNNNNNQYASINQIENQSTSSESSSLQSNNQETILNSNNNNRNLVNTDQFVEQDCSSNLNEMRRSSLRSNVQSSGEHQSISQSNVPPFVPSSSVQINSNARRQSYQPTGNQLTNQLNNSLSEDQLPTYQQAISKMPPV